MFRSINMPSVARVEKYLLPLTLLLAAWLGGESYGPTTATAGQDRQAEQHDSQASRELPAEVSTLLEALEQGKSEALMAAREISAQADRETLEKQAITAFRTAWSERLSQQATLHGIAVLEKWASEHDSARNLLIRLVDDDRSAVRQGAIDAIVRTDSVENTRILPLMASLRHAEPAARYRAAEFLGKFGEQAAPAVGALVRAAQDDTTHAGIRWGAVFALRDIGQEGVAGLIEVLQTTEQSVAYKTLDSLAVLGEEAEPAYEEVTKALASKDPQIRWRAASVLGGLPSHARESQPLLRRLLNDSDQHVREAAQAAIKQLRRARPTGTRRLPVPE